MAYSILKPTLYDSTITRVIFVLHSQGGIEGSMILDWLLAEIPQDLLQKLEIYTFGNAANHFNNPHLHLLSQKSALAHPDLKTTATTRTLTTINTDSNNPEQIHMHKSGNGKAIPRIEHYANTYDFVSRWGVLFYTHVRPSSEEAYRFMGMVFEDEIRGHMFVQHYLDNIFPLSKALRKKLPGTGIRDDDKGATNGGQIRVDEDAGFMTIAVESGTKKDARPDDKLGREGWEVALTTEDKLEDYDSDDGDIDEKKKADAEKKKKGSGKITKGMVNGVDELDRLARRKELHKRNGYKVRELSRLWQYRNGRFPDN